ncbi:MAG TPA: LysR family transcriptional regulator [Acidimicrobiales bacterium]|nr:LysR family transcriptional regulator [Acidimicrobiales bacterium]
MVSLVPMDLRQLQALVAIADRGSFSAAAAALHTVQSNVSSHVARLEKELGAELVDRQSGRLTEEGQAVVERARRVGAELDALVADVAAMGNDLAGTVRMGMIGTTARWLTPVLLDALRGVHPRVRLVIVEGTSTTLEPAVMSGSLDVAIVNLPAVTAELSSHPLFDEDLVLVVSDDHPLAASGDVVLADLDGMELLMPAPGTQYRQELDDSARRAGIDFVPRAELDGLRLIASLTLGGYGPAILPATGAAEGNEGFVSLPVRGLPRRRVGLVTRRGRPSAPARAVLELLDTLTPRLMGNNGLHPPAHPAVTGSRNGR